MPLPIFNPRGKSPPPPPLAKVKAVVAVAAGKGGVGKSTITVNLALALSRRGIRVGIMDTDIYGPSIRKMLPEDQRPSQKGEIIYPAVCKGIPMISMAYFRREHEATAVRAPIANSLISQFIKNVAWGDLDLLLIDFPPGTGDVQLTLSQQAPLLGALMVTTPQEVALLDVRKAISLFEQVKVPILGIVENMSYFVPAEGGEPIYIFGKGGGERLAQETGTPLLGKIPLDPLLCSCGDRGESLFERNPQGPATQAFQELARLFQTEVSLLKEEKQKGLFSFELVWKEM